MQTNEDLGREVEQLVYHATVAFFERLERERRILWNGHHAAQKAARGVKEQLSFLILPELESNAGETVTNAEPKLVVLPRLPGQIPHIKRA